MTSIHPRPLPDDQRPVPRMGRQQQLESAAHPVDSSMDNGMLANAAERNTCVLNTIVYQITLHWLPIAINRIRWLLKPLAQLHAPLMHSFNYTHATHPHTCGWKHTCWRKEHSCQIQFPVTLITQSENQWEFGWRQVGQWAMGIGQWAMGNVHHGATSSIFILLPCESPCWLI